MRWLFDLILLVTAVIASPWWATRMARRGKLRTDWAGRFGRGRDLPPATKSRVLIHAVSVGEINAIRELVAGIESDDDGPEVVISVTTDTGLQRARSLFGDRMAIVRYPFDFNFAVRRFLSRVQPDLVVLVELEVWPSFTSQCARRGIPIIVVNGRLTERSAARYAKVRRLVEPSFRRLHAVAAQSKAYAERFERLGVPAERIHVTGTMKWDSARIADEVDGADALADAMGIDRSRSLIVAGSTAPDEHSLLHEAVPAGIQLLCAPRKPEWFDAAADHLPGCVRRSSGKPGATTPSGTDRFLLDTIGELRQAYALSDVVVIGRSFGDLHGSDMMEPAALGKPVVVGAAVEDFRETVDALLAGDGIVQTDRANLADVLRRLIGDPAERRRLAENARDVIRQQQGASDRHHDMILSIVRDVRRDDGEARGPIP
jgi:3-deoxy-D-manno-octulosonic-acid transferase